jgi:hypothetical protein
MWSEFHLMRIQAGWITQVMGITDMTTQNESMNTYSVIRHSGKTKTSQIIEVMAKDPFMALTKAKVLFKGEPHPNDKYEVGEEFI